MTHTNIEQSKQLLKLGLDNKSADLVYCIHREDCTISWEEAAKDEKNVTLQLRPFNGCLSDYALPCWSAESLLEMLPTTLYDKDGCDSHSLIFQRNNSNSYLVEYALNYGDTATSINDFSEEGELLNILVEAILWLLKNKYL